MPKQTFFNLPILKQQKIIVAAHHEFSKSFLSAASVANIIKEAGIPRGSFYQYFEDINDIFYYILEAHSKDIKRHLTENFIKYKGDIFESFIDIYQYIMNKINAEKDIDFFKNIFLNMDYKLERMFLPNLEDNLNEIIQLVDIEHLNISNRLQLIYIIEIIEAVMMRNLIQSYKRSVSKEKNIEIFVREIILIKNGIYKK